MLPGSYALSKAHFTIARVPIIFRFFSSTGNFGSFSNGWWDIDGPMSVLHDYNYVRVPFIAKSYALLNGQWETNTSGPKLQGFLGDQLLKHAEERNSIHLQGTLGGLRILDVGCGGGILSEALAKCGAHVVGIDPCKELIQVAEQHKQTVFGNYSANLGLSTDYSKNVNYIADTLESYASGPSAGKFDIVVASEVIEHIPNIDKPLFINTLRDLTRPGGLIVFTTPGRSIKSCIINIILAENVFKRVPRNTHQYSLFIGPDLLSKHAAKSGLTEIHRQGLFYLPFTRRFLHLPTCDFLYMIAFRNKLDTSNQK
ncbi:3-demethylubiquinone-9 3-methyltransferase [Babesia ovis]|uniref:Ubiquinone biosynthesis O-methyltransferase, mitochondrial n=1 Tax=Babesia ovis TaxID=5869 RepID=A0A9W5WVG1_BABOV|nr:3-demethylubiquinone-9 3-methyltransferase [Babesia ovis]